MTSYIIYKGIAYYIKYHYILYKMTLLVYKIYNVIIYNI